MILFGKLYVQWVILMITEEAVQSFSKIYKNKINLSNLLSPYMPVNLPHLIPII